ncbi:MAG TPA: hypothetical protein VK541_02280 [Pedobacter sp.]|uniref:hypothetical protein n=1 Tax=Pedobacter sp. TaxID=1411316 RepID=UPI002CFFA815|nr:hypothetical protein [Pedobacter sp.]HMI01278.1 hypothetical protein [Pedobacter sp.]
MRINLSGLSLLTLFFLSVLFGCKDNDTRSFMPGTYVNHAEGTYAVADDTLVVEHAENNNYLIHRRTGFNRIENGKKGNREYETEEWNAVYDQKLKTLRETRRGKILTFYPKAGKLKVGNREYIKLK